MAGHPDLEAEQAYIDRAYACLEATREAASRMTSHGRGRPGRHRAGPLRAGGHLGHHAPAPRRSCSWATPSLCFGRIDRARGRRRRRRYYIGRIAVADEHQEPVVVDWRAPVAEPFYRATGRQPMGLARRRHFATRGRQLLAIEDELFGDAAWPPSALDGDGGRGDHAATARSSRPSRRPASGKLGDIVATIQGEQDEIIRAELPGVLVVQGGPGTGKTVVALHRAAYLLYTHRFPLEGQGVLVVGPNRLFLGYIEQVLPSLGEAGVELAVLADLVDGVRRRRAATRGLTARVKGDLRMAKVLRRAVRDRERPLRARPAWSATACRRLRLTAEPERGASSTRPGAASARHNAGRRYVESERVRRAGPQRRATTWSPADGARPAARTPRGARGARADVAGAHAGRSCSTTCSARRRCSRSAGRDAVGDDEWPRCCDRAPVDGRRGRVDQRRRAAARRGPRPARARSPRRRRRPSGRRRRSAPTATSWSTRPRTSRPCSCGCSPGARSTAR